MNNVCLDSSFLKNVKFENVKFKNIKFFCLNFIGCEFTNCEFENCQYETRKVKNIPENIKNQMTQYEYKKNKNSEEESSAPQNFELNYKEFPSLDQPSQNNDNPKEDIDNVFYTERQSSEEKIIQEGQVEDENEKLIQEDEKEEFDLFERLDKEINDLLEKEFNSLMDENANLLFIINYIKHSSQSEIEFNEKMKNQIKNLIINDLENNEKNIEQEIYMLKKFLELGIKKILEISFFGTSFEFSSASEANNLNLQR